MYSVYILKSEKTGKYYIGSTQDIKKRLKRHNKGYNIATRVGIPWNLVYVEKYENRNEAYKREMQIKSYKSGQAFKKLIS